MLLDAMLAIGIDTLGNCLCPPRGFYEVGGWSEYAHFRRQLGRMKDEGWIVWDDSRESGKWVLKLTAIGKSAATDDIDPIAAWARKWDGEWRFIVFDLPANKRSLRRQLNLWLERRRFGHLQGSVRIVPRFEETWIAEIGSLKINPKAISFIEGRSFGRSSDSDLVKEAWNFKEINLRHRALIDFLKAKPPPKLESEDFAHWVQMETALWRAAFKVDPFLPEALLPKNYQGKRAWENRCQAYAKIGSHA